MQYKVEDCFLEIRNGANIKQGDVDGGFPITRIETLADDKFNRDRMGYAGITKIDKYRDFVLEDGDLLMSHINSPKYLGRTVVYHKQEGEFIIHGMNLLKLKAKRDLLVPDFAEYSFTSIGFRSQIAKIMKKSVNQASLSVSDLKKLIIDVPSLKEQREIVNRLHMSKQIVNDRNTQLEMLDELIKSRFVEMFGSPHERRYITKTLPDIVDNNKNALKRGPFGGSLKKDDFLTEGYLVYEQRHAIHNDFEYEKYFIDEEKYREMVTFKVQPKDLLVSCSGVTLGRISEVPQGAKKGIINQALLKITLNQGIMNNTYFMYLFRNEEIQDILFGFSRGSGIPNFPSMNEVKMVEFLCPPIHLQNQFATFVQQVDKLKVDVRKSLDETQVLFDSLMKKYFG